MGGTPDHVKVWDVMGTHFIDRRLNPKGKSLANRQRFIRRARAQIKEAVQESMKTRGVRDFDKDQNIAIPAKGTKEPRFRLSSSGGERDMVHPGNKEFGTGDRIRKPRGGKGEGGKDAANQGEGEDDFQFTLSQDEILDLIFDDLELPNLEKTANPDQTHLSWRRSGLTHAGTPNQLNLIRTMRHAYGRRIALGRPQTGEVDDLKARLFELEAKADPTAEDHAERRRLIAELEALEAKRRWIPFIDPIDVRYNAFEQQAVPVTRAVMFCLMDVSGSMGEREKDLAKRFFMLLHLFLKRRYERLDIIFIRHTHEAQEVDEDTFFYSRQSGGTIVSTAIEEMKKVWRDRYAPDQWNIYVAQASDGYTQSGDAARCVDLLNTDVLPHCRHYAYIEILDERELEVFSDEETGAELWRAYRDVHDRWNHFAMKRIARPGDVFPVFRELFSPRGPMAAGPTPVSAWEMPR